MRYLLAIALAAGAIVLAFGAIFYCGQIGDANLGISVMRISVPAKLAVDTFPILSALFLFLSLFIASCERSDRLESHFRRDILQIGDQIQNLEMEFKKYPANAVNSQILELKIQDLLSVRHKAAQANLLYSRIRNVLLGAAFVVPMVFLGMYCSDKQLSFSSWLSCCSS